MAQDGVELVQVGQDSFEMEQDSARPRLMTQREPVARPASTQAGKQLALAGSWREALAIDSVDN